MTRSEAVSLVLVSLLITSNAVAASKDEIKQDPQAIAVAQKALAAMGGIQAILTYQDSVATGNLTLYGSATPTDFPITFKTKGTRETRVEVKRANGTNIRIMNAGNAVIQAPDGSLLALAATNTFAEYVNHIPLLSILSDYQATNVSLLYKGTEAVNDQADDVVAVTLDPSENPELGRTLFFVNQSNGLIDKIQYTNYAESDSNSTDTVDVYFTDYQQISGIAVPFRQTTFTNGTLDSDIVLGAITLDVGLTDDEFALPAQEKQ
jgi:hypothetical protein